MSIHDVCTLYAGVVCAASLRSPCLHGIIDRHPNWGTRPPLGQTGPSIAPEIWYVGGTLSGLQLQRVSIRDGHIDGKQTHILLATTTVELLLCNIHTELSHCKNKEYYVYGDARYQIHFGLRNW